MTNHCAPIAAAALALGLVGADFASAQAEELPPLASPLTFDEAIAIAQEAYPGEVAEVALDWLDGVVVIDIEIATEDGEEVEFKLDAQTGEILEEWVDANPADDPDQGEEEGEAEAASEG